jgi:uncharacterized membrane protein
MISSESGVRRIPVLVLLSFAPIFLLFCLLLLAPPDGTERAQILQFFGRFHPLSVHLPIALLIIAPLLELAGRNRRFSYLLPAIDFLLGLATFGAILAAFLGWFLARDGGYSGPLMKQHMWAGLLVATAAWLCWMLRIRGASPTGGKLYIATLVTTVAVVSFTGYRGGQLSQGENHLTEFMPAPLANLVGVSGAADSASSSGDGGPGTFYGARIQPLLNQHCTTCHGRNKHKSNLRLDNYAAVIRGGKHGAVIKAGDTKGSELLRRVSLTPTDDDFMPPEGRRPLSASDIKIIEQWIAGGASGTQLAASFKEVASNSSTPEPEISIEEIDPALVASQRASLAPAVAQVKQHLPNVLDYESRGSANLVVTASWMGQKFGDDELGALAPVADRIVNADFSSTAITDKSAVVIARMKNLRALTLRHTKITDSTLQALGPLDSVETISLFDTKVTPAALESLAHFPKLRHAYVGETKIPAEAAQPDAIRGKLVF